MPFAAIWMNLEIITLSQKKKEKDRCHVISLICGILKNNTNELIYKQKQTHRHRKQTFGYQRGKAGDGKLGVWD